jgi:hypothetical protein
MLHNEDHPMFKRGRDTNETKAAYRAGIAELAQLEAQGVGAGIMIGARTREPKVKSK